MTKNKTLNKLTKREAEVLSAVRELLSLGYSPSLSDVAEKIGVRSRTTVRFHLTNLEAKKRISFIRRDSGAIRAIQILAA